MQFETIYKADFNTEPYVVANYPPLYPLLVATINSMTKIPLFQAGRIISLFFSIVCAIVIGVFSYHLTNNKLLGVSASIIFLGNPYVMVWSSLARIDMMALAFSLLGLFILFIKRDALGWICLACMCFLVSAYTRQTYILAGPLAGFVWLWHLNRRRSLVYLIIMGSSTLLIFGMINALTNGGFYTNIVVANINIFDVSRTLMMMKQLFIIWPVILVLSAAIIILVLRERLLQRHTHPEKEKSDPFLMYGLCVYSIGALITAITVGKVGSDINYFLELMAVCSIWFSIGLKLITDQNKPTRWFISGLVMIQLIWVLVGAIPISQTVISSHLENLPFYNSLFQRINASTKEGIVLSDDYLDMVVLSGQDIYYQPFEYGQLYQAGLWDPSNFSERIKQKDFPLVVIGGDTINKECCWVPPLAEALSGNYQMEILPEVVILTPNE